MHYKALPGFETRSAKLNFTLSVIIILQCSQVAHAQSRIDDSVPKHFSESWHAMPNLKPLKITSQWSGSVMDGKLRTMVPKENHVVTDGVTWEKIWSTWVGEKELPTINFRDETLLVFTALGPNVPCLKLYESKGHIQGQVGRTMIGGSGFGYRIVKIPRRGIKTFFSSPIK